MMKRLRYSWMILLLVAALQAAGQEYVIDQVCPGAVRHYRVNGEKDSRYQWMINNSPTLLPASPFTEVDSITGLEITGSEVTISWTDPGRFELSVSQRLLDHCDTSQMGIVEVIEPLEVSAVWNCSTSQIILEAPINTYIAPIRWTTAGDGTFADTTALSTIYNLGRKDERSGTVELTLMAKVMDLFSDCLPDTQHISVYVPFDVEPLINHVIDNNDTYRTVDLAKATAGNDPDLVFSYYYDRNATSGIKYYSEIITPGTYYIKATSTSSGCSIIDSVEVIINKDPNCSLFIPNAFSPNPEKDIIHSLFMIYCMDNYPDAKMYIFDQLGNKIFEKKNYGNVAIWGNDQAWWDGKPDRGRGRGERVAPGTYYYVLDLGNGEVKKSFVFVSY